MPERPDLSSPTSNFYHARRPRATRAARVFAAMAADAGRARLELAEERARCAWGELRGRLVDAPPGAWLDTLARAWDDSGLRDLLRDAPAHRGDVARDLLVWWLHAPSRTARIWIGALSERLLGVPVGVDA